LGPPASTVIDVIGDIEIEVSHAVTIVTPCPNAMGAFPFIAMVFDAKAEPRPNIVATKPAVR
jgi:hypothetical protein